MSILIKNINGTNLIEFPQGYFTMEIAIGSVNCALVLVGILSETLVIASILRVRQKSVDTLFILSLCCADMIFNLYSFTSLIIVLSAGGWTTGKLGCHISLGVIVSALAISIASVTYITLNRYMAIMRKSNITRKQAQIMIAGAWTSLLLIVLLYIFNEELSNNSIALQPARTYCLLDFASRDSLVVIALITIITFMTFPIIFMIVAYTQIILYYRRMNRSREYVTSEVIIFEDLTFPRCPNQRESY